MRGLNLLLFFLALLGCAAAYYWGVQPRRRSNRLIRSPRWRRHSADAVDMGEIITPGADEGPHLHLPEAGDACQSEAVAPTTVSDARAGTEAAALPPEAGSTEQVIALHITAPQGTSFSAADIRSAAESVGMRYTPMGVFHHYGVGQLQSRDSLFCLANMFEPGTFDLDDPAASSTPGLLLLMQLPLHLDGKVAFELLLNAAQRLVRKLGGHLSDESRQPLTPENVQRLRALASAVPGRSADRH